jgi:hypothetical protein
MRLLQRNTLKNLAILSVDSPFFAEFSTPKNISKIRNLHLIIQNIMTHHTQVNLHIKEVTILTSRLMIETKKSIF